MPRLAVLACMKPLSALVTVASMRLELLLDFFFSSLALPDIVNFLQETVGQRK